MTSKIVLLCLLVLTATAASFAHDAMTMQMPVRILARPPRAANNKNSVNVGVEHSRQGTDVAIEAQRRLWESQNGRNSLDGQANYNQHFGGPAGRQRPNYGAGLMFRHRF